MSRKQKKKDAREQSTRQLMGIDDITDYGIATRMGELVFFAIKPTNISVLPDAGVGARIYALLNVVKGMAEIEMLALNSKESFENNKAFYGTHGMPDIGANQMYYNAKESGPISTMPDIPGLAVWHEGHIGVYIGNGQVVEAMGTRYGVVKTELAGRGWTHWLKVPYIRYD